LRSRAAVARNPAVAAAETTPDLSSFQGYLEPAPVGIDAQFAWGIPGGKGAGIVIVDLEFGWNFGHEDLARNRDGLLHGPSLVTDHGTAVLGVLGADDNGKGVLGIAHEAFLRGSSAGFPEGPWNPEEALQAACDLLNPGSVALVELQTAEFLPYDTSELFFSIVQSAVAKGIYVIEAAGDRGRDLDLDLPRQQDSGAILVGAGGAGNGGQPRVRVPFSNFGSRLDLQGWGEGVATCGGRTEPGFDDLWTSGDPSRSYTRSFRETSSAAAIVAGVVACVAGCVRAAGRTQLTPDEMRSLLVGTGTQQEPTPVTESIGSLPNLRAALEQLRLG
jgi:subtilisin family serine protease